MSPLNSWLHQQLVFIQQPVCPTENQTEMNLFLLKVKLITSIPDRPCQDSLMFQTTWESKVLAICPNNWKKSRASLEHFCVFPLTMAHTFLGRGHSHKIWPVVSGTWQQTWHSDSIWTFRWCRLALVGRLFEQALQRKLLLLLLTEYSILYSQTHPSTFKILYLKDQGNEFTLVLLLLLLLLTEYSIFYSQTHPSTFKIKSILCI